MNSSTIKLFISGMLLLFLSACAPPYQTYYPASVDYSGKYGATQRSDDSEYPYNSNYHYDQDEDDNDDNPHHHDDYNDGYN